MAANLYGTAAVLFFFLFPTSVQASNFNDFVNNLSTDLAPIITLFGEQVTKQFLSESTSFLDNVIFAMAPLGILTAVVSTIRVSQSPSLKAFIGRAQEGRAAAEIELLSSTSNTVSELWEEGGITRVLGQPKILEVVKRNSSHPDLTEPNHETNVVLLHTVVAEESSQLDKVSGSKLSISDDGSSSQPVWRVQEPYRLFRRSNQIDIEDQKSSAHQLASSFALCPNLALNVGRETRPLWATILVLLIGVTLQTGTMVYGGLSVYYQPLNTILSSPNPSGSSTTQKKQKITPWAFPLAFMGTSLVCTGMFLCALIINNETKEIFLERQSTHGDMDVRNIQNSDKPAICDGEIFWIQAEQRVGDQTFPAYIGRSFSRKTYIRSTRAADFQKPTLKKQVMLFLALGFSMIGFVLQFVGLRYLHPSVTLSNLGATLVMAVLRATLRTQRQTASRNELVVAKYPHRKDAELIHLARVMSEYDDRHFELSPILDMKSFKVRPDEKVWNQSTELVHNLELMLNLPGVKREWADENISEVTGNLGKAINETIDYIWSKNTSSIQRPTSVKFRVLRRRGYNVEDDGANSMLLWSTGENRCVHSSSVNSTSPNSYVELVSVSLYYDGQCWRVNMEELQAVLSLWYDSRVSDSKWKPSCRRIISIYDNEDAESRQQVAHEYNLWVTGYTGRNFEPWPELSQEQEHVGLVRSMRMPLCYETPQSHSTQLRESDTAYFGWMAISSVNNTKPLNDPRFLYTESSASILNMCAQDLFISMLADFSMHLDPITQEDIKLNINNADSVECHSQRLEDLSSIFTHCGLGDEKDALACIYPALKIGSKQPTLSVLWPDMKSRLYQHLGRRSDTPLILKQYRWIIQISAPQRDAAAIELASSILTSKRNVNWNQLDFLLNHPNISEHIIKQIKWVLNDLKRLGLPSGYIAVGPKDEINIDTAFGNEGTRYDWTCINEKNYTIIARHLISLGSCNINSTDNTSRTCLAWAASRGDLDFMAWLLKRKADLRTVDNKGHSILYNAARQGREQVLSFLCNKYHDRRLEDMARAAVSGAIEGDHVECLKILRKMDHRKSKDWIVTNRTFQTTVLHLIAQRGAINCWSDEGYLYGVWLRYLDSKDINGRTPLDLASQQDNPKREAMMEVFLQSYFPPPSSESVAAVFPLIRNAVMEVFPDRIFTSRNSPNWWNFGPWSVTLRQTSG